MNHLLVLFSIFLLINKWSTECIAGDANSLANSGSRAFSERSSGSEDYDIHSAPFQRIEAGSFIMNKPLYEYGRTSDKTQVRVTISKPFEIMKYEVTQSQWVQVMGSNPSYFKTAEDCDDYKTGMCPNNPVENVSWDDVQEFIKNLNNSIGLTNCTVGGFKGFLGKLTDFLCLTGCEYGEITGDSSLGCYRLPTEAEWKYSAKRDTKSACSRATNDFSDLKDQAWYRVNSGNRVHKVGMKPPNPNGLYDIYGNVWEWVQTGYARELLGSSFSSFRVIRGGSWANYSEIALCFSRHQHSSHQAYDIGFRLVRTL